MSFPVPTLLSGYDSSSPSRCLWCGVQGERSFIAVRQDGMPILECKKCHHRAVLSVPSNLDEIYNQESYFLDDELNGYQNYDDIPLTSWSVELMSAILLSNSEGSDTSILDIGCATGLFLDVCRSFNWKTYGIDISEYARRKCEEKGHAVVAAELERSLSCAPTLITAFHFIEHLTNFDSFWQVVSEVVQRGGRFLFVVPNVDFSQSEWNGFSDSFVHISYFDPQFIREKFPEVVGKFNSVLNTDTLVFGYVGDFSNEVQDALNFAARICEGAAGVQNSYLSEVGAIEKLSPIAATFITTFIARAVSAPQAQKFIDHASAHGCFSGCEEWLQLSRAFAYLQNGNLYGVAASLHGLVTTDSIAKSLKDKFLSQIANMPISQNSEFPLVSIWVLPPEQSQLSEEFFLSIGAQTYPFLRVIVASETANCLDKMPGSFQGLVDFVDISGLSAGQVFEKLSELSQSSVVFRTDGKVILNQYCIFSLFRQLQGNEKRMYLPRFLREGKPEKHYPGKGTIQRFIERVAGLPLLPPGGLSSMIFDLRAIELSGGDIVTGKVAMRSAGKNMIVSLDILGTRVS